MRNHVLITGPPGSGKTCLTTAFQQQGFNAVDADSLYDLAGWFDRRGREVAFPEDADRTFLTNHRFLWNRASLERFLERQATVFLFGLADNMFEVLDVFDRAYFLKVSPGTLVKRLADDSRINPMGKTPTQQQIVLETARLAEQRAREYGLVVVDGEMLPEDLLRTIAVR